LSLQQYSHQIYAESQTVFMSSQFVINSRNLTNWL